MADHDREVRIEKLAEGYRVRVWGGKCPQEEFVTHLPFSLTQELSGSWGREAFDRIENPLAYAGLENMLQRRKISLQGMRVLDVGCRYGTSSLAASRLGACMVVGIDIDLPQMALGRTIVCELDGYVRLRGSAEIHYVLVPPDRRMPFVSSSFDVVLCNALFEHIAPEMRTGLMNTLWRLLRPGGYFIVHETPSRWWPRDGHTTGLWLVPWLPRPLVQLSTILFCRRYTRRQALDWSFMIAQGIRGVSYKEIADGAPGHDGRLDLETNDIEAHFDGMLQIYHSSWNRIVSRVFRSICTALNWGICKPLGWPSTVVLPSLYMALRKT